MVGKILPKSMKNGPQSSTNTNVSEIPPITKTMLNKNSEVGPKRRLYFESVASWGTLGGLTRFWTSEVRPLRSQSASNDRNLKQT